MRPLTISGRLDISCVLYRCVYMNVYTFIIWWGGGQSIRIQLMLENTS